MELTHYIQRVEKQHFNAYNDWHLFGQIAEGVELDVLVVGHAVVHFVSNDGYLELVGQLKYLQAVLLGEARATRIRGVVD
jgi:hypothetical protein